MDRRNFAKKIAAATASFALLGKGFSEDKAVEKTSAATPFKSLFAPTFGHFHASAGKNPVDQLQFMYDAGFRAFEDNGMLDRPREVQDAIAKKCEALGMRMGLFVAYADFGISMMPANRIHGEKHPHKEKVREFLKQRMEASVELSKRMNNKFCTVVPGRFDESLDEGYQFANVVENLKFCAEICEKSGLVMVLEPLNPVNHPDLWLKKTAQGFAVCKAVNSPSCKILYDVYHQQITEGNLIMNIDRAWSEIAYFQVGDVPGRKEATTGEINYKKVFSHIYNKGFRGFIGLEHGQSDNSKAGDEKMINAYRSVDV